MKVKTIDIDSDVEAVLRNSTINGNNLVLPGTLDRPLYAKTNKVLEMIGFKWTKGVKAHVGQGDSAAKLSEALNSGNVVDEKKTFQFFETPKAIADLMVSKAQLNTKSSILEPSAGMGAIVKAIHDVMDWQIVFVCEINPTMKDALSGMKNVSVVGEDFLKCDCSKYDRIIMNPPFTGGQDIEHVLHAYDLLKDGGILVTIMSTSWVSGETKRPKAFRKFLEKLENEDKMLEMTDLPSGTFKGSGTNVATVMLVLKK